MPFFANALFHKAAAHAQSASTIFEKLVELNLVANAGKNLLWPHWIGIAKTEEIVMRSKDRSANVGNMVIQSIKLCNGKERQKHS